MWQLRGHIHTGVGFIGGWGCVVYAAAGRWVQGDEMIRYETFVPT